MFIQTVSSTGKKDIGAIASVRAANIYGLDILAENIQVSSLRPLLINLFPREIYQDIEI